MRYLLLPLLLLLAASPCGCKTAQIAVRHPMTGMHIVAKFEAQEEPWPVAVAVEQ
jgi:hypothetical protein